MKFKLPFFNKKPLTEAELLQVDKRKLDAFEKNNYIENNMLVVCLNNGTINYYNKHTVLTTWQAFIEKITLNKEGFQYKMVCHNDNGDDFSVMFYNIENAKEYVKKLTALIEKLNNN